VRLITYRHRDDADRIGVLSNGLVVDAERFGALHGVALPNKMLDLIDMAATALPLLRDWIEAAGGR
jgi:hypothetical protein